MNSDGLRVANPTLFTKAADDVAEDPVETEPQRFSARAAHLTWITRLVMWSVVFCGPAAMIVALIPISNGPVMLGSAVPQRSGIGPAGFAQLYVVAYLQSGAGDEALRSYFPEAPLVVGPAGTRWTDRTVVTGLREVQPGYWSIVVAAHVRISAKSGSATTAASLHLFVVPILATGGPEAGGTGRSGSPAAYVATGLPAEVGAPATGAAPELGYESDQLPASGPLSDTVTQFLMAYLTGTGRLDRYLSPGHALRPIVPAPYRQVTVNALTSTGGTAGGGSRVPADGAAIRVSAVVEVSDAAGGRWPLGYALTLSSRAGRWEVTALDPAPALAVGATPTRTP